MQNRDWSFLAQQTRDNNPLLKSQQFLQAAQGAGQSINNAGNVLQQGVKKKQYRAAGNEILGLMENGQLNEQTMAGVLKKNRLGMKDAQEVIGLMQKSGTLEEMKARTAGINANTQTTSGKENRDQDAYKYQQSTRNADRDLDRKHKESQINLNNANAAYTESGKAAGSKPVDPAGKVKSFIANHPQIKALMTPGKEGDMKTIGENEVDYYKQLAASEGFEIKFRGDYKTAGDFWSKIPGGLKPGEIKIDEKTGKPKMTGDYFVESIVYVGNQQQPTTADAPPDVSKMSDEELRKLIDG